MSIITTLIIIAVLILVHEWGHFITARRIGIPVHEFSLGFGYRLFHIKKNGVEYSIRLIPLGGYVRMAGEEPGDMENPEGFNNRKPWEKMLVAVAGPFMNFVAALVIFIYIFSFIGIPIVSNEAVIGKIIKDKPAAAAGLKADDKILTVNETPVKSWNEFTEQLAQSQAGQVLTVKVNRNDQIVNLDITPGISSTTGLPEIGVLSKIDYEKQNIFTAVKIGFQRTYELTMLLFSGLGLLFSGGASVNELAGPVGITKLVGEAAQVGSVFLLSFTAFLSINLGILNLLPIPALDGSRIVFGLIEAIRRKPIEPEREGFIHWIGFMFLMLLIVIVTYNDIVRLIKG